jgi:hypothetical protein
MVNCEYANELLHQKFGIQYTYTYETVGEEKIFAPLLFQIYFYTWWIKEPMFMLFVFFEVLHMHS